MSAKFEMVKYFYMSGMWDAGKVHNAIGKWITEEEYHEIVGFTEGEE